jgi:hypothetical protein
MTIEVSQQEAPEEAPSTDEPAAPESPETTPEQPSEPESPPEPEQKPEPEPDPDEGEAKQKAQVPEAATKAGRKRAARKSAAETQKKGRARAKAKSGNGDADADKKERVRMTGRWKTLTDRMKERGHTAAMRREMRELAEKLERNVPKWAQEGSASTREPKEETADGRLAKEATAFATHGKVVDGKLVTGDRDFGANVTEDQVAIMRGRIGRKDVLHMLGDVSESKLAKYARGDIKRTDLPDEAYAALKALNKDLDEEFPTKKFWVRKDAVICLFLHRERKSAQKKPKAAKKEEKEAVAA